MAETAHDTSVEAFEAYLNGVRMPGTAGKYASATRLFLAQLREWGFANLEDIPPNILSRYASGMTGEGFAAQTTHLYVAAAKRYLRWVREQGADVVIPYPPDLPRVQHRMRDILPPEFLVRYMDLANQLLQEPYRTAVQLMPCVGLRGSEIAGLSMSSLSRREVTLRGGVVRDTIVLKLIGKGGDERIVPVLDEGRPILNNYFKTWRRWQKGTWLFPRSPGRKHISDRTLREMLSKLCDPLGMDFSPHTMRRTYLVTLWRRGVDATIIARIAGHKNLQTTFRHYLALDDSDILKSMHGERRGA